MYKGLCGGRGRVAKMAVRFTIVSGLPSVQRILVRARFDFALSAVTAFGAGLVVYLFDNSPPWVVATTVFVWLFVLGTIVLLHVAWQEGREQADTLETHIARGHSDEAVNLTTGAIRAATRGLRAITEELKEFASAQNAEPGAVAWPQDGVWLLKKRMLSHVCGHIRNVFEADTRALDGTTWPHNYFKLALFEPDPGPDNATSLRRTFWDYPGGVEPSADTETFDFSTHRRAGVVVAFMGQGTVVIEDIKTENLKPPDVKRWINRRENQADDYESMVCTAIVSGEKNQPGRKCLGVLVIDTNRQRYFKEEREYKAFLGDLLSPFRTLLTFVLEFDEYFCR